MKRTIRVEVCKKTFPYQSTNPEAPGAVHWQLDEANSVLYCSQAAFSRLRNLPPEQQDELVLAMGAKP